MYLLYSVFKTRSKSETPFQKLINWVKTAVLFILAKPKWTEQLNAQNMFLKFVFP